MKLLTAVIVGSTLSVLSARCAASWQDRALLIVEVSVDNIVWSREVTPVAGGSAYFRIRATKIGPTPVLGLAGVTCQPTISSFAASDHWTELTDPRTHVPDVDGEPCPTGRLTPFGRGGMGTGLTPTYIGHRDPFNVLRYAGHNNTAMTINMAWGLGLAQLPPSLAGTYFNPAPAPALFKARVTPDASGASSMIVDIPIGGVQNRRVRWYREAGGLNSLDVSITQDDVLPAVINRPGGSCDTPLAFVSQAGSRSVPPGEVVRLVAEVQAAPGTYPRYQWMRNGEALVDSGRVTGSRAGALVIDPALEGDSGVYSLRVTTGCPAIESSGAAVSVHLCRADLDGGTFMGVPDGGVTIDDLAFFLGAFADGSARADVDDGSGAGNADGSVTVDDLIFYLGRFDAGC